MGLINLMKKGGNAAAGWLADFGSGKTKYEGLDTPKVFNLILFVGVVAFGFGIWIIGRSIASVNAPRVANTNTTNTTNVAVADPLAKLRKQDTDKDGLSDYDELFIYHSSPYLWSSAGDGVSDGVKVKNGQNPNCPVGKSCTPFTPAVAAVDANGNLTPDFLRSALVEAGVAQSLVDQMSDADLLRIYKQVAANNGLNTNTNDNTNTTAANTNSTVPSLITNTNSAGTMNTNAANANANTNASGLDTNSSLTMTDLSNLSASEIRQLLIQSGVDQNALSQMDDATIVQVFQQALNSNTNQ